jgi:sigma-E factor negative regulatory protein RseC
MKAAARVREVNGSRARLECDTATLACAACAGRGGCALKRLAGSREPRLEVPARAIDGAPLVPGSRVTVEVAEGELLGAALRAYLPPLAGVLAGPLLARAGAGGGEGVILLCALAGLLIGWLVSRAWLRRSPPRVAVRLEAEAVRAA